MAPIAGAQSKRLCLLSLDGGGIRGLSSIMILKDIMDGVNQGRKPENILKPWQLFDLMGGTSTGGLIAIMLGRLRMSLDECERAYRDLSEAIFKPKRSEANIASRTLDVWQAKGRFDAQALEDAVKEIVKQTGVDENEVLYQPESSCRVFVSAVLATNSCAVLLRSYENNESRQVLSDSCKIWEACRATSAAKTFFDPITIGPYKQKFTDGGLKHNNPVQLVYREANELWRDRIESALLISIGTGSAPGPALDVNIKGIVEALKSIATETEDTANNFAADHPGFVQRDQLFRFNVYHGLAEVGLEEYKEREKIASATYSYMVNEETKKKTRACIHQLSSAIAEPRVLHSAASLLGEKALSPGSPKPMTAIRQSALNRRLISAVVKEDLDAIERVLKKGANPCTYHGTNCNRYSHPGYNYSVLQLAIFSRFKADEIVLRLIERGANIHHVNSNKRTALHVAALEERVVIADLLLEEGADINAQDESGYTPLHLVTSINRAEMVRFFKMRGADVEVMERSGRTALDIASEKDYETIESILES